MHSDYLPFTEDVQTTLLAAFLLDRKLWIKMYDSIEPEYFENIHNARIFQIMKRNFLKYKDFATKEILINMANKLFKDNDTEKRIERIFEIKNTIPDSAIKYLDDECNIFVRDKKIEEAVSKIIVLKEERKYGEIETVMRDAVQWNNEISLGTEIHQARERYEQLDDLYSNILPWPWKRLNTLCDGMLRKQLYSVVAASSVGKTIFCDNVAWYSWFNLKKNIVSISTEISELKKGQRMDAYGFSIPMRELKNNREEIIKFYEDNKRENRLFIKEFPSGKAVVEKDIYGYLYNLELYAGLHPSDIDLIILDGGNLLRPHRMANTMYENIGQNFEALRAMAIDFDCPVLASAQLGKDAKKKNVTIDDINESIIAESFKIQQSSDWVLALHNGADERANELVTFKLLKDRDSKKDTKLQMRIYYEKMTISDFEQD